MHRRTFPHLVALRRGNLARVLRVYHYAQCRQASCRLFRNSRCHSGEIPSYYSKTQARKYFEIAICLTRVLNVDRRAVRGQVLPKRTSKLSKSERLRTKRCSTLCNQYLRNSEAGIADHLLSRCCSLDYAISLTTSDTTANVDTFSSTFSNLVWSRFILFSLFCH